MILADPAPSKECRHMSDKDTTVKGELIVLNEEVEKLLDQATQNTSVSENTLARRAG